MPTLCLIDSENFDVLTAPVDREFPLGGFTMYVTGHMLFTGKLADSMAGFKKYYDYQVKGI